MCQYTGEELQLCAQFVNKIGSLERARDLLDKYEQVAEVLGINDDTPTTSMSIADIARTLPSDPSVPAGNKKFFDMEAAYNPSAMRGPGF